MTKMGMLGVHEATRSPLTPCWHPMAGAESRPANWINDSTAGLKADWLGLRFQCTAPQHLFNKQGVQLIAVSQLSPQRIRHTKIELIIVQPFTLNPPVKYEYKNRLSNTIQWFKTKQYFLLILLHQSVRSCTIFLH